MATVVQHNNRLLERLLRAAATERVVLGRVVTVADNTSNVLEGVRGVPARGLAGECPLRLTALDHVCGAHIHLRNKLTGRVGCFAATSELLQDENFLEDCEYTPWQYELTQAMSVPPVAAAHSFPQGAGQGG